MPYDHYAKTIAALVQPWMFGPQTGARYQQMLQAKFNAAANKAQIDTALSLGNYAFHTTQKEQDRLALRAVLLAHFLIDGRPVAERDSVLARSKGLDLGSLKRAFASRFPALADNGNRNAWAPANFTDPATLNVFHSVARPGAARVFPAFQFIIHGVGNFQGPVFDNPSILAQYEVLSMSLMSNHVAHAHDPQGVILRVPANNILAAAPTDVAVQNYAPGFNPAQPGNVTITENLMEIAVRMGGLNTPAHLNQNPRGFPYYNEVVVCGRGGVPLPHGVTTPIVPVGLFMLTDNNGVINGGAADRQARELRVKACARQHGLPVLYIPRDMSRPGI